MTPRRGSAGSGSVVFQAVSGFFDWWFGELAALVPAGIRRRIARRERVLAIDVDADGFALAEHRGDAVRPLGRVEHRDDAAIEAAELRAAVRKAGHGRKGCVLRIGDGRVLHDRIHLPMATEENLREVVHYQLDRLTPFSPEEVRFDCRVLDRHPTAGTISVDLAVVPRAVVADSMSAARTHGLRINCITYADEEAVPGRGINLLPPEERPAPPRGVAFLNGALAVVIAGLIAVSIAVPMERDRKLAESLERAVEREKAWLRTAESRIAEREATVRDSVRILERKRRAASATMTIERLTHLLPDDTWLTQLRLREGTIRIVGQSPSSSRVIGLVEGAPGFANARAVSAARRNAAAGTETFQLEFSHVPLADEAGGAQ